MLAHFPIQLFFGFYSKSSCPPQAIIWDNILYQAVSHQFTLEIFNKIKWCFQIRVKYIPIFESRWIKIKVQAKFLSRLAIISQIILWLDSVRLFFKWCCSCRPQCEFTFQAWINSLQQLPEPWLFLKVSLSHDRPTSIDNISQNTDMADITSTKLRCDCDSNLPH